MRRSRPSLSRRRYQGDTRMRARYSGQPSRVEDIRSQGARSFRYAPANARDTGSISACATSCRSWSFSDDTTSTACRALSNDAT